MVKQERDQLVKDIGELVHVHKNLWAMLMNKSNEGIAF